MDQPLTWQTHDIEISLIFKSILLKFLCRVFANPETDPTESVEVNPTFMRVLSLPPLPTNDYNVIMLYKIITKMIAKNNAITVLQFCFEVRRISG